MLRIRSAPGPIWKSPAWQVAAIVTVMILALGQASKARAAQGGVVASLVPSLATLQATLFEVKGDTLEIKNVLNRVETKIDSIELNKYKEPSEALWYGDVPALKQYLLKGHKLPPPILTMGVAYPLALGVARKRPDRIELLQLYLDNGWSINERASITDVVLEDSNDDLTRTNIKKMQNWASKKKNKKTANVLDFYGDCKELTILDLAYTTGDRTVVNWLVARGADPNLKHACISRNELSPDGKKLTYFSPSPNTIQEVVTQ